MGVQGDGERLNQGAEITGDAVGEPVNSYNIPLSAHDVRGFFFLEYSQDGEAHTCEPIEPGG